MVQPYPSLQQALWSDDLLEDVLPHVGVHSRERVVQQVVITVTVDRPSQAHTLLLATRQVNTLMNTHSGTQEQLEYVEKKRTEQRTIE